MRLTRDHLLAALFLICISVPMLIHVGTGLMNRGQQVLESENRFATPFPSLLTATSFTDWTNSLNNWMADHFGLRQQLIELHGSVRDELDLIGNTGSVLFGQDGWLFFAKAGAIEDYQGFDSPEANEMQAWVEGLSQMAAQVEAQGGTFVILIAPNKHSIYRDKMPSHMVRTRNGTRLERIIPLFHQAGMTVIDPTTDLLAARNQPERLYARTDTHWTAPAAYIAYAQLIEALEELGIELPLMARGRLEKGSMEAFKGDLSGMLETDRFEEQRQNWTISSPQQSTTSQPSEDERPALYRPTIHRQPALPEHPSLFISADSFTPAMLPFLKESFGKITVVRRQDNIVDLDDLAAHPADIVVFQIVERSLRGHLHLQVADTATTP